MDTLVKESFLKEFKGKRVFITGHTGFKGSWLTLLLQSAGAEIAGYALSPQHEGSHFERLKLDNTIHSIEGDIRDGARLESELNQFSPEVVFHLAAQALVKTSYIDPKTTLDINIGGGVNLLEAVRRCKSVRALVFVTSDKCYENQEWVWGYRETDSMGGYDPYSASKGAIEIVFSSYLRSFFAERQNFGAATVRAGNVIGGGDFAADRIIPDCIRSLLAEQPINLRNPQATRPWQHVLEPISGYIRLAAKILIAGHGFDGAWNFGPKVGDARTVLDVANTIKNYFEGGKVNFDESLADIHEAKLLQLNSDKSRQLLGWDTRWNFDQTLAMTGQWYQEVLVDKQPADVISREQIAKYFGGKF
ncbi:CDP-glucose 4,6-dehydratase [Burkholderiales bacterium]|nr:CDP-glucose 4,6-dehydratase [Burkholderiales bacterium]